MKHKQPELIQVPCNECQGESWYYLAWKHPNGQFATAQCEFCINGKQWSSLRPNAEDEDPNGSNRSDPDSSL